MKLTSMSFNHHEPLALNYAYYDCGGNNISPQLAWTEVPDGTKSFVLIVDDPDAPGFDRPFVHWVVYDIPADIRSLAQGDSLQTVSALQGKNDFGDHHYDGPCPPTGSGVHHYHFTLYALNTDRLLVKPYPQKHDVVAAMQGHILAQAGIVGLYEL